MAYWQQYDLQLKEMTMHKDIYTQKIKVEAFGGSKFKVQSALREVFNENQIDWVAEPKPHPLTGISKVEKKESQ